MGSQAPSLDVSKNSKLEKLDADPTTPVDGLDGTVLKEVDLLTEIREADTSPQGTRDNYSWSAAYSADGAIASQGSGFLGGGSGTGAKTTTYTYDEQGRIVGASKQAIVGGSGDGDYAHEYDDKGHVTKSTYSGSSSLDPAMGCSGAYDYDGEGRISQASVGMSGEPYTFAYDDAGRLSEVLDEPVHVACLLVSAGFSPRASQLVDASARALAHDAGQGVLQGVAARGVAWGLRDEGHVAQQRPVRGARHPDVGLGSCGDVRRGALVVEQHHHREVGMGH